MSLALSVLASVATTLLSAEITKLWQTYSNIEEFLNVLETDINQDITEIWQEILLIKNHFKYIENIRKWLIISEDLNLDEVKQGLNLCISPWGSFDAFCFDNYLRRYKGISYIDELRDVLLEPNEFLRNKGGDCEDFSYFYTVLINKLKERGEIDSVVVRTYDGITGISLSGRWAYTICYAIEGKEYGHCIVGICNFYKASDIIGLSDEEILNHCFLFEPQTGYYVDRDGLILYGDGYIDKIEYLFYIIGRGSICSKKELRLDGGWVCIDS